MCILASVGAWLAAPRLALASEYHGQVTFGGLPVPGATITATQGNQKIVAISDQQGSYSFADLADGTWKINVEMQCFSTMEETVTIAPNVPSAKWELKLLSLDQIVAKAKEVEVEAKPALSASSGAPPSKTEAPRPKDSNIAEAPKPQEDSAQQPSDGLLINGSVNNAATSQFSLAPAFGNNRSGKKGLYTGGFAVILGNSALDARPYSLSGQNYAEAGVQPADRRRYIGGAAEYSPPASSWAEFFCCLSTDRERQCYNAVGAGADSGGTEWRSAIRGRDTGHAGAIFIEVVPAAQRCRRFVV